MALTDGLIIQHNCEDFVDTIGSSSAAEVLSVNANTSIGGRTAWHFTDSAASVVKLANPPALNGTDWSVSVWFYGIAESSNWKTLLKSDGSSGHQVITQANTNNLGAYSVAAGSFLDTGYDLIPAEHAGWTHIVVTASGGQTIFYINGSPAGSPIAMQSTTPIYAIGNYHTPTDPSGDQRWAEYLDDYRQWNRALSASEVATLHSTTAQLSDDGQVFQARFDGSDAGMTLSHDAILDTVDGHSALVLDGSGDIAIAPFSGHTVKSIGMWFKLDEEVTPSSVGINLLDLKSGTSGEYFYITLGSNTGYFPDELITISHDSAGRTAVLGGSISANVWHKLDAVWGGSYYSIFLDGVEQSVVPSELAHSALLTNPIHAKIGGRTDALHYSVDGSMADVRIHDRSLTSGEVTTSYQNGPQVAGTAFLETGLVAKYDLNTNTNANDSVGSNNGTLVGSPTFAADGDRNIMTLDGVSDSVDCGRGNDLTAGFTMSTWIKTSETGREIILGEHHGGSSNGAFVGIGHSSAGAGKLDYYLKSTRITSSVAVNDNEWHLILATWTPGSEMKLYIDGQQVASGSAPASFGRHASSTFQLGSLSNASLSLSASMDDVRIWNRALSASEVATLHSTTAATSDALVKHLKFDGNDTGMTLSGGAALATVDGRTTLAHSGPNSGNYTDISSIIPSLSSTAFSVSMWFKKTSVATAGTLLGWYQDDNNRGNIHVQPTQSISNNNKLGGTWETNNYTTGYPVYNAGQWYHFTYTDDGSTVKMYLDGVEEPLSAPTADNSPIVSGLNLNKLLIGAPWFQGSVQQAHIFDGSIDDVRIYSKALTTSEIASIMIDYDGYVAPDTTAPVITVLGNNPESTSTNLAYTDAGATAVDAVDGAVAVVTTGLDAIGIAATETFAYTGADQSFVIPAGITSITACLWGAGGAGGYPVNGAGGPGAAGGYSEGTIAVTPGETITLVVGGAGNITSGANTHTPVVYGFGGRGYVGSHNGAGGAGGGLAGLFRGSVDQSNALIIAGGGAGGGGYFTSNNIAGAAGGLLGLDGGDPESGTGGTQTAGGTAASVQYAGQAGSALQGGNGGHICGGGGAGYFGGAGGGHVGGSGRTASGGGGSSFLGTTTDSSTQAGSNVTPPYQSSDKYVAGVGVGGAANTVGGPALIVVSYSSGSTAGTHTVTYTATDAASNVATATRTVTVIPDTTNPVVTVTGANPVNIAVGTTYTDAGATATDNIDGPLAVVTTGLAAIGLEGISSTAYTGVEQTYTVPAGVTSITAKLWGAGGASGGASNAYKGAAGGYIEGTFDVTPGEDLTLVIGEGGHSFGSGHSNQNYGGGGYVGPNTYLSSGAITHAGEGGGLAGIFRGSPSQGNAILIAGGGGGSVGAPGGSWPGVRGGTGGPNGADGQAHDQNYAYENYVGGTGGTQVAGGIGALAPGRSEGGPGSALLGGTGRQNTLNNWYAGGAGGAGYFGGGGGCWGEALQAGGGGGSNYAESSVTSITNLGTTPHTADSHLPPEQSDANYVAYIGHGGDPAINSSRAGNALAVISYSLGGDEGTYAVTYTATDTSGNVGTATRIVNVGEVATEQSTYAVAGLLAANKHMVFLEGKLLSSDQYTITNDSLEITDTAAIGFTVGGKIQIVKVK